MRLSRWIPASSMLLVCCLTLAPGMSHGADDCSADVTVSLIDKNDDASKDGKTLTTYRFSVEASVEDSGCHVVDYVLLLDVLTTDGDEKQVRKPGQIKLQGDQSLSQIVEHQIPAGGEITEFVIDEHSCSGC